MTAKEYFDETKNRSNSYLLFAGFGLIAGIITRLSDYFPNDDLWSFSSIATLFGFWMFTVTLVTYYSSSNKNAAINVLLYLISMNISFYLLNYILGLFITRFYIEEFQWNLFILYSFFSIVCSVISYVLYFWKQNNKVSNFLYGLPVSGLLAETIGVSIYLYNNKTFLFQFIFDVLSFIILGYWFYRKVNNKLIYIATIATTSLIGYLLVYRSFL